MPLPKPSTISYISNTHNITLGQLTNRFSHDVSNLLESKQTPLILELQKRGMTLSEIGALLGVSKQRVFQIIEKQNEK
jgi:DNA-directed RNA polymerase specialized sigma subunit